MLGLKLNHISRRGLRKTNMYMSSYLQMCMIKNGVFD